MYKIHLCIMNKKEEILALSNGSDCINLLYEKEYNEGDSICLALSNEDESSFVPGYFWIQLDDAIGRALVYLTGSLTYMIPFGEKRRSLSPRAFYGTHHLISIQTASEYESASYHNLAYNPYDCHESLHMYPHAEANVETRGESVFAARNAIDGITANSSHGDWPYTSWGINRQDNALIKIDFGNKITADRILLYTRADFPHDNWWTQLLLTFSDSDSMTIHLKKSSAPHEITFPQKQFSWIQMSNMKKSDDPSPFPALTQLEVFGYSTH